MPVRLGPGWNGSIQDIPPPPARWFNSSPVARLFPLHCPAPGWCLCQRTPCPPSCPPYPACGRRRKPWRRRNLQIARQNSENRNPSCRVPHAGRIHISPQCLHCQQQLLCVYFSVEKHGSHSERGFLSFVAPASRR
jgi:hypothetical protein